MNFGNCGSYYLVLGSYHGCILIDIYYDNYY